MTVNLHPFPSQDLPQSLRRSSRLRHSRPSPPPSPRTLRALKRRKQCADPQQPPPSNKRRSRSTASDDFACRKKRKENLVHDTVLTYTLESAHPTPQVNPPKRPSRTPRSKQKSSSDSSQDSPPPSPRPTRPISPPLPSSSSIPPLSLPSSTPSSSTQPPPPPLPHTSPPPGPATIVLPEPEHIVPSHTPPFDLLPPSPPSLLSRLGPDPLIPRRQKDSDLNIWKIACQERVEIILRRYGAHTIRAVVASQSRPSSPNLSPTQFKMYTPATYQPTPEPIPSTSDQAAPPGFNHERLEEEDDLALDDMDMDLDEDEDDEDEDEDVDLADDPSFTVSLAPDHPLPHPHIQPFAHPLTPPSGPLPPLSTLPVSILAEPRFAFMGRGTPPDRRRRSEWCASPGGGGLFLPCAHAHFSMPLALPLASTHVPTIDGLSAIFDPNPGEWTSFLQTLLGPSSALPPAPSQPQLPMEPVPFGQGAGAEHVGGMGWFELGLSPPPPSPVSVVSPPADAPGPPLVSMAVESSTLSYALG